MSISYEARRTAKLLNQTNLKVVFAESCTGGFVAASLTKIPGISAHHCGGMVVYRNETKMAYLGISGRILKNPGPVSRIVAEKMAVGVLERTPEAMIAASVTGHLGPQAPPDLDGVVYIGTARRNQDEAKKPEVHFRRISCASGRTRVIRQRMAIEEVLRFLNETLQLPTLDEMADSRFKRKPLCELLLGESEAICVGRRSSLASQSRAPRSIIFPGAFNPLHVGHREMAAFAEKAFGGVVEHEISITNVDKPPLRGVQIIDRVAQFSKHRVVWLTRAPTFAEKSRIFPGAVFMVGVDTVARVADVEYYSGQAELRDRAVAEIASSGCRFLVFGRKQDKTFMTLDQLSLPSNLRKICDEAPNSFRVDLSSSDIRHRNSIAVDS